MIPRLRPYQLNAKNEINAQWSNGLQNVLYVLPTGGGKTVTFADILHDHQGVGVAVAHRQELVGQISLMLARFGVRHRIIGPRNVIKLIIALQRIELGSTFYDPNALIAVAGVDTITSRKKDLAAWAERVTLWVQDEAHHVLRKNKWGKAIELFPNAKGLGVTATPERADGAGLGRHADGVFDTIVQGPTMRELINEGFLADYRIFAPPSDLDLKNVKTSADGDFNRDDVRNAVRRSRVVGDVVAHYLRIAPGLSGVTFASDVDTAGIIAQQYNAANVPAAVVSAKTPDRDRNELIAKFRDGRLKQLVNVDLFGEGFDVPRIEVVSMARPTISFAVYAQQFGRALRPLDGKSHGIIIDHVGNVRRKNLGLPDAPRNWTLDRREKAVRGVRDPDMIPVTTCLSCLRVYEAYHSFCPFCGVKPEPVGRSKPEQVEGDLTELTPEALAVMRGEVARLDGPPIVPEGMNGAALGSLKKKWRERQEAQSALRQNIAWWAGYRKAEGMDDQEIYKRFYWKFGVDIMTAQTLGRPQAEELAAQVYDDIAMEG